MGRNAKNGWVAAVLARFSCDKILYFFVIMIVARIIDSGLFASLFGFQPEDRDVLLLTLFVSSPRRHERKPQSFQSVHAQGSLECNEGQRPHGAGALLWNGESHAE